MPHAVCGDQPERFECCSHLLRCLARPPARTFPYFCTYERQTKRTPNPPNLLTSFIACRQTTLLVPTATKSHGVMEKKLVTIQTNWQDASYYQTHCWTRNRNCTGFTSNKIQVNNGMVPFQSQPEWFVAVWDTPIHYQGFLSSRNWHCVIQPCLGGGIGYGFCTSSLYTSYIFLKQSYKTLN